MIVSLTAFFRVSVVLQDVFNRFTCATFKSKGFDPFAIHVFDKFGPESFSHDNGRAMAGK